MADSREESIKDPQPPVHSLSIIDKDDPRSVVNLISPGMRRALESAYEKDPGLFGMDERTLAKELRTRQQTASITDNRLRLAFWQQYDQTQARGDKQISVNAIVRGVCSPQYFLDHYLKRPEHIAWLLCVPASYEVVLEETLQFGLEQMRDILALPHELPGGKINTKLLEIKTKITEMMHTRVKGAVVQKQLNVNATPAQVAKMAENLSMEELMAKQKELEKRDRAATNGGNSPYNRGSEKVVEAEIVADA